MNFTIDRDVLSDALGAVAGVTGRSSVLPVYGHTLILATEEGGGRVTFKSTDGDSVLYRTVPADVEESGEVMLPVKDFRAIAKKASAAGVVVSTTATNGRTATVKSGRFEARLNGLHPRDFPDIHREGEHVATVEVETFKDAFDRVDWAVYRSAGANRPSLRGVFFRENDDGRLTLDATNGHVMAKAGMDVEAEIEEAVIAPPAALSKALIVAANAGAETIDLALSDNYIVAEVPGKLVAKTRLIGQEAPDTSQFLRRVKNNPFVATVNRGDLLDAVERVLIMTGDKNGILFTFDPDGASVESAGNYDLGGSEDRVECDWDGENGYQIKLNGEYVRKALKALNGDTVRWTMDAPARPTYMTTEDESLPTDILVMPLHLGED